MYISTIFSEKRTFQAFPIILNLKELHFISNLLSIFPFLLWNTFQAIGCNQKFSSLARSKMLYICFLVLFFLSLLAFYTEIPYQKYFSLVSLARTQIINLVSYKWRSIA